MLVIGTDTVEGRGTGKRDTLAGNRSRGAGEIVADIAITSQVEATAVDQDVLGRKSKRSQHSSHGKQRLRGVEMVAKGRVGGEAESAEE